MSDDLRHRRRNRAHVAGRKVNRLWSDRACRGSSQALVQGWSCCAISPDFFDFSATCEDAHCVFVRRPDRFAATPDGIFRHRPLVGTAAFSDWRRRAAVVSVRRSAAFWG